MHALVIGGTGPTGHFVVNGLLQRGYSVDILHRGGHEIDEIPPEVFHIHTDPYDKECLEEALQDREYDVCFAMYGRLRAIAEIMQGRVSHFLSVGGAPAYRGYMNPYLFDYSGIPVPLREGSEKVRNEEEDSKGYRIWLTEEKLFAVQPEATHFRYPYIYGAYQLVPREWLILRRILDKRPFIILPDGGLTLHSFGYAENVAHAMLLALDKPSQSKGKVYNVADEQVLSLRQVTEIIIDHTGSDMEIISMPFELAECTKPLMMQPQSTHRVLDIGAVRQDLGYRDKVPPRQALQTTVDWLIANPPEKGGTEEWVLEDPFDYDLEDALVAQWRDVQAQMSGMDTGRQSGVGMAYSGPGGRARSQESFEE